PWRDWQRCPQLAEVSTAGWFLRRPRWRDHDGPANHGGTYDVGHRPEVRRMNATSPSAMTGARPVPDHRLADAGGQRLALCPPAQPEKPVAPRSMVGPTRGP